MTRKNSNGGEKKSKTDSLIDEAVEDLDLSDASDEIVEAKPKEEDRNRVTREPVAKIDLQQYVEKEAYLRLAADFDNFRRRALKERQDWERTGQEKVLREFLDIFDNFCRGIAQVEGESPLVVGMKMVFSQMEAFLKNQGLERIQSLGTAFDPAVHEAVARIEDATKPDGTIVEELKSGFRWKDRLLRPASVVVSKRPEGMDEIDEETESELSSRRSNLTFKEGE